MSHLHLRRPKESFEARRLRGEISCAECRRNKLRCNKAIPCYTCVRRGCEDICPNGTLAPAQRSRREPRHDEIWVETLQQMSQRIHQLEIALQLAHTRVSTTQHPLLSRDLLLIKGFAERPLRIKKEDPGAGSTTQELHGTKLMPRPGMRPLLSSDVRPEPSQSRSIPGGPLHGQTFPFMPLYLPAQVIQERVEEKLPSMERASALIEAYLENFSWGSRLVDREQIFEDLIPQVYLRRRAPSDDEGARTDPHLIALLFAVFSCGAITDLTLSPWNEEAHVYYQFSWTSLGLKSTFENASLHSAQAMALLGVYDVLSCRKGSLESTWRLLNFCMSLAYSIRLNRDPGHFHFSAKLAQRRRQVFWELFSLDSLKSVNSCKPMSFAPFAIDCELPEDKDTAASEGDTLSGLWHFRYRYAKEVLSEVSEKLCSVRPLKYSVILSLDQKIRNFDDAFTRKVIGERNGLRSLFRTWIVMCLKESTLLLLHRNFFIRALIENPANPAECKYAPSFLSTYRSASVLLGFVRRQMEKFSNFLIRLWPVWANAVAAGVILGSVAACVASPLAPQAFAELDQAVNLFLKLQEHPIIREFLPVLLQLHDRAHRMLCNHGRITPPYKIPILSRSSEQAEKELSAITGSRSQHQELREQFRDVHGMMSVEATEYLPDTPDVTASFAETETVSGRPNLSYPSTSAERSPSWKDLAVDEGLSHSLNEHKRLPSKLFRQSPSVHPNGCRQRQQSRDGLCVPREFGARCYDMHHGKGTEQQRTNSELRGCAGSPDVHPSSATAGLRREAEDKALRMDVHQLSSEFNSLSTLSPITSIDADFDVSLDMLSSTGDGDTTLATSDDVSVAALRTLMYDSRFFGPCAISWDEDVQLDFAK